AVLSEISLRLDGMPLALELAAARFTLLSPQQVLERLVQRFRFLESDSAGRDHRHRNLSSLLEWSYGLLSAEEQRLLNWTAIFVQSWSTEAFVALDAARGLPTSMPWRTYAPIPEKRCRLDAPPSASSNSCSTEAISQQRSRPRRPPEATTLRRSAS